MKTFAKLTAGLLLLLLLLVPSAPAAAQGLFSEPAGEPAGEPSGGRVIFGDDFVLEAGETLGGDLVIFGGNVSLETGSTVNGSLAVIGGNVSAAQKVSVTGDLVLIGGNVSMDGTLDGDAVLVGGQMSLGETAVVDGDITTVGGNIQQAPGAQIHGEITDNSTAPTITIPDAPPVVVTPAVQRPTFSIENNPFMGFLGSMPSAIAVALVAVLASLFLHPQMVRVSTTVTTQPVLAGGFGLLAAFVSLLAIVLMAFTFFLIPVSVLAILAFVLAWLFGLVAMGQEVGDRLAQHFRQSWSVPASAGLGTFLLMVLVSLISAFIPCVGGLAAFLIGMAGFGAVILTYFGSRSYPVREIVPLEVPPAS